MSFPPLLTAYLLGVLFAIVLIVSLYLAIIFTWVEVRRIRKLLEKNVVE